MTASKRRPWQFRCIALTATALTSLFLAWPDVLAQSPRGRDQVGADTDTSQSRIREGEVLTNQLGELRESGGRITFYPSDSSTPLYLLENLALERVSRALDGTTTPRMWSVSGLVTEFNGDNYLLLRRAMMKARAEKR